MNNFKKGEYEFKKCRCIVCGVDVYYSKYAPRRMYCGGACKQKMWYRKHTEECKRRNTEWAKNNRERSNEIKRHSKRRIRAKQKLTDKVFNR